MGARVALGRLLIEEGRPGELSEILEPVAYDQRAAALLARARLADVDQPDVAAGLAALDRGDSSSWRSAIWWTPSRVADPQLRDDLRVHDARRVRAARRAPPARGAVPPPAGAGALLSTGGGGPASKPEALDLFSGLAGPAYSRRAALLSLGQEPRWHRFLAGRLPVGPEDHVLDVATGTGAVAAELVLQHRCRVTGIDQSAAHARRGRARGSTTWACRSA